MRAPSEEDESLARARDLVVQSFDRLEPGGAGQHMSRIIPGVQVTVVKEVVPPQLAPSGVLGIVGLVAPPREGTSRGAVERVSTWARFRELYGRGTARVMPEAQQAFQNGVNELVVVDLESSVAEHASVTLQVGGANYLTFRARARGTRPNGLEVQLVAQGGSYEVRVRREGEDLELYRNVSLLPGERGWLPSVLRQGDSELEVVPPPVVSAAFPGATELAAAAAPAEATIATIAGVVTAILVVQSGPPVTLSQDVAGGLRIAREGVDLFVLPASDAGEGLVGLRAAIASQPGLSLRSGLAAGVQALPAAGGMLVGGIDASQAEYIAALGLLEDVADVDLVTVALQDHGDSGNGRAAAIYAAIIAHCEQMSADARGRLGFGQVSPAAPLPADAGDGDPLDLQMADLLRSDRFVLLAPHGALGATIGRIGSLPYHQSPTFKTLAGLGDFRPALRVEQQRQYLQQHIVPIAEVPGRGVAVVRGLTTDGDQINVRRIADRAVRGVRIIGELFIGKLNTEDGRNALKQKLTELLLQMQAEDALVPSTDGTDPAFKLDVYSSQADFAQGIVRVDLAVRPVRAIDYIYATVLVQV